MLIYVIGLRLPNSSCCPCPGFGECWRPPTLLVGVLGCGCEGAQLGVLRGAPLLLVGSRRLGAALTEP